MNVLTILTINSVLLMLRAMRYTSFILLHNCGKHMNTKNKIFESFYPAVGNFFLSFVF